MDTYDVRHELLTNYKNFCMHCPANFVDGNIDTWVLCEICGAPFCSQECMRESLSYHKMICDQSQCNRISNILKLISTDYYVSFRRLRIAYALQDHHDPTFNISHKYLYLGCNGCFVCNGYQSSPYDLTDAFGCFELDMCDECKSTNRGFCKKSHQLSTTCHSNHVSKLIPIILLTKEILITTSSIIPLPIDDIYYLITQAIVSLTHKCDLW